jgi:hypothetical protein
MAEQSASVGPRRGSTRYRSAGEPWFAATLVDPRIPARRLPLRCVAARAWSTSSATRVCTIVWPEPFLPSGSGRGGFTP